MIPSNFIPVDQPTDVQKTVSETLGPIRGGDNPQFYDNLICLMLETYFEL